MADKIPVIVARSYSRFAAESRRDMGSEVQEMQILHIRQLCSAAKAFSVGRSRPFVGWKSDDVVRCRKDA